MEHSAEDMYYPAMIGVDEFPHRPVLQLLTGHFHESSAYRVQRPHGAGDWLLIHTVAGAGRFGHAGGELIAGPGDWVLIRPGTLHDYSAVGSWELLWVHFQPRAEWLPWLDWPEIGKGLMRLHIAASGPAAQFAEIDRLFHGELSRREAFAMNALEALFLECDMHNPRATVSRYDRRVTAAMDYLDRHLSAKTSLDEVAAAVGLSPSRLAHLFKAEAGVTPQVYLESRRMQRATELLQRTGFSIQQIAAAVGFESPFYFSRRFKAATGKNPSAFRAAGQPFTAPPVSPEMM
jgi:AraC family transcriptional regulator of arabinose operon